MNLHGQNFVGGELKPGAGKTFRAISPLDSAPLAPEFHAADVADVEAALAAAAEAFVAYRETTGDQRAAFL